jgi:hypothetical protein
MGKFVRTFMAFLGALLLSFLDVLEQAVAEWWSGVRVGALEPWRGYHVRPFAAC